MLITQQFPDLGALSFKHLQVFTNYLQNLQQQRPIIKKKIKHHNKSLGWRKTWQKSHAFDLFENITLPVWFVYLNSGHQLRELVNTLRTILTILSLHRVYKKMMKVCSKGIVSESNNYSELSRSHIAIKNVSKWVRLCSSEFRIIEADCQKNWPLGYELLLMPPAWAYQTLQDTTLWTWAFYALADTMKNYIEILHYSVTAIKNFYCMKCMKYKLFPFWL